jgi:predicted DCC family thiol-disulfide oxidoreductase YuxK
VSRSECVHEPLVVEAVVSGRWPERVDDALVAHTGECEVCSDVAALALLIHDDHERSRFEVQVPAAGQVWWRSAVRARLESTAVAMRPMTVMHAVTAAITVGILLAAVTVAWPMLSPLSDQLWAWAVGYVQNAEVANALASGLRQTVMIGAIAVAVLVAAPLALYYVLSGD